MKFRCQKAAQILLPFLMYTTVNTNACMRIFSPQWHDQTTLWGTPRHKRQIETDYEAKTARGGNLVQLWLILQNKCEHNREEK
jgi:hypothetical protein